MNCEPPNIVYADFNKICRICLEKTELTPFGTLLKTFYKSLVETSQEENACFPSNICKKCKEYITKIAAFIDFCKITESVLTKIRKDSLHIEETGEMSQQVIKTEEYLEDHRIEDQEVFTDQGNDITKSKALDTKKFKCKICQKVVVKKNLVRHSNAHKQTINKFQCRKCNKVFKKMYNHGRINKLKCTKDRQVKFKNHEEENDALNKRNEEMFDELYASLSELSGSDKCYKKRKRAYPKYKKSEKLTVYQDRQFCCHICNDLFETRTILKSHIRHSHTVCLAPQISYIRFN